MKALQTPSSNSGVRRLLAPYFELALNTPELVVSVPVSLHAAGIDWPVVKLRLRPPEAEIRHRLLIVSGLCPLDGGSVDAVFHATLRLLQNSELYHHTELVAFPLANPAAAGLGSPTMEDEVRRLLLRHLAAERYEGLLVLHDDPAVDDLTFRLPPEEGSLNLATELLSHFGSGDLSQLWGKKLTPLERGDLEARGANEGSATVLHALLPARRGRAACTKQGADVILDVLAEFGAIENLWKQPV